MRRSRRGRFALLALLVLGCAAGAIPAADAGSGVIASFGSLSDAPALGGTMSSPRGVAVNAPGAGGVAPGTVYVVDAGNLRIGRFGDAGDFVSVWGQDVVQAGAAGDTGTGFEICAVAANCKAGTSGPWGGALSSPRGVAVSQSTGDVYVTDNTNRVQQFTATGSFVRAWGAGVVDGGATGTGALASSSTSVSAVATTSKTFAAGQTITGAGIQPGTTIATVGAGTINLSKPTLADAAATGVALTAPPGAGNVAADEQQTVTLGSNTTGGTFTLTYATPNPSNTTGTTAAIAHNASAAGVQTALEDLANVAVGDIAVTGAAGGPWTVTFQGTRFGDTDVNQMTANATGLTVSAGTKTATIATIAGGAGAAELCAAATECIAGKSLSGAGQFLTNGALAQPAVAPSGDVYVPDAGNARVQEFTANGTFVRAWGWDVVAAGGAGESVVASDERQSIVIANASGANIGGGFTLTFDGQTTAAIPWNATAAAVDSALEALSSVGVGNVAVTGGPAGASGGTFRLRFTGARGGADVPQTTVDVSGIANSGVAPTGTATTTWAGGSGPGFEICTVAAQCKAGVAGPDNPGQFAASHPTAVAVDSAGAVYAADGANARVERFDSTGHYLSSFAPAGTNTPVGTGYNLAVDRATDRVLVGSLFAATLDRRIQELDSSGAQQDLHLADGGLSDIGGIGVNPDSHDLYVSVTTDDSRVLVIGTASPPEATISAATGVSATGATFNGTVTPPGGILPTRYRFEYSTDGSDWTSFPVPDVDVGSGSDPVAVHQNVTGLAPSTHYLVRLVAATGSSSAAVDTSSTVDFTTGSAPPLVAETSAGDVAQTSASLRAKVNPHSATTAYRFEWGETAAYGQRAPSVDPTISGSATQSVQAPIAGLQPDTTYHFRVVATNPAGTTEGPDRAFRTLNAAGLPGNRAYELVSPVAAGAVARGESEGQIGLQAASDGQRLVWPLALGSLDSAARDADGWAASQLGPGDYRYLSSDLSCGVLASGEPLAPGAPTEVVEAGGENLFRRDASGGYTVLTNVAPTNAAGVVGPDRYASVNGSADCGHVVFATPYTYSGVDASGLYEWTGGALRNVGVLPDGSVATAATLGASGGLNMWNAVSEDGSRIFFSATSNDGADAGKKAVFVRRDGASTVKASASKTATVDQGAVYQLASKTGDHVLFLANYGLTSSTSAGPTDGNCALTPPAACDLYDYDVETGELTDLSVDTDAGGARVAGVLGASDDASYVYFAARGQLVPDEGRTAAENFSKGSFNVYLAHAGQHSFVGLLRAVDLAGGGGRNGALVARSTAESSPWATRVTPDGGELLFASSADVTGYDGGGVAEAYLYSADSGETVCVSCRRDGQPSVGAAVGHGEPTAPLASDGSVGHRNPLNPPRSLSAAGTRVFFEMPDALAAGAVEGDDNVYEWSDGQLALLATGTADASTHGTRIEDVSSSGDDVFVSTPEPLLAYDVDGTVDVYDVRADGGLAPPACVPPVAGCPGIVDTPPLFQAPLPPARRRAAFSVKRLRPAQRARLAAGKRVLLAVRVNRAGRVSARGVARIDGARVVVLAGARRAAGRGVVRIPIVLAKVARERIAAAGALRVSLTVAFSGARKDVVRSIVLRRPARR